MLESEGEENNKASKMSKSFKHLHNDEILIINIFASRFVLIGQRGNPGMEKNLDYASSPLWTTTEIYLFKHLLQIVSK